MNTYEGVHLTEFMTYDRAKAILLARAENLRQQMIRSSGSNVVATPIFSIDIDIAICDCQYYYIPEKP